MAGLVVLSLALVHIPLGRLHHDLVEGRYFLSSLVFLAIAAGAGWGAVGSWVGNWLERRLGEGRAQPWVAGIGTGALLLGTLGEGTQALGTQYAFQDEYVFLRSALAPFPSGCSVYQLPVRSNRFPIDIDSALDAPRSPLWLARPGIRFLDMERQPLPPDTRGACVLYYETAACSMEPTPRVLEAYPAALRFYQDSCAAMHRQYRLERLEERSISGLAHHDVLGGGRAKAALYRLLPR
jgi:hypothetical protein